jgi:hypothetical protein
LRRELECPPLHDRVAARVAQEHEIRRRR